MRTYVYRSLAFIDCCLWLGLDRGMPMGNVAAILDEILGEADALIL
jgi:hypothetical protein